MWMLQRAPPDCDMVLVHDDDLTRLSGIVDSDVSGDNIYHMHDYQLIRIHSHLKPSIQIR
jgi:hypothetical protein